MITTVLVDGTNPGRDQGSNETEALLDLEWAHATATGASLRFYLADPTNASSSGPIFDAIQRAVSDNTVGTIDVSFELCGFPLAFYENTLDPVLLTARVQKQQVFIATGDFGAAAAVVVGNTCEAGGTRGVNELAADPNAIAVGGSQPTAVPTTGSVAGFSLEKVYNTTTGASGGGASAAFSKPNYQAALTPNDGQRDVPDVSLLAALTLTNGNTTGVFIGQDAAGTGQIFCCVQGTSVAAPLWAGIGALMEQRLSARLSSNFNAQIYTMGRLNTPAGFRDVRAGDNSFGTVTGFAAVQGHDQATGWGSGDVNTFVNAFVESRGAVLGGIGANNTNLLSSEIYNPTTGTFSSGGTFADTRQAWFASPLPNGTILIVGGSTNNGSACLDTAKIYNPASGSFTSTTGNMTTARCSPAVARLFSGKVLITGKDASPTLRQTMTAELYDPVAKTFSATGTLLNTGSMAGATITLMANGKVLVAGGNVTAQTYDPNTGAWSQTAGQLNTVRYFANAVLLPTGKVLIAGGTTDFIHNLSSAELFDPQAGTFSPTGSMPEAALVPVMTAVSNGKVLVVFGDRAAALYNPATGTFGITGSTNVARSFPALFQLNNGKVLAAGGAGSNGAPLSSAELYDPVAGTFSNTGSLASARQSPFGTPVQ